MSVSAGNRPAVWNLADSGWKDVVMIRLNALTQERNRKLNTLTVMSDSRHWEAMSPTRANSRQ
jgi:hypothetical protein